MAPDWMPSNKPLLDSGILEAWRTAAWRPPELDDWMTRWLDEGMMRVGMRMLMKAGKDEGLAGSLTRSSLEELGGYQLFI